MQYGHCMCLKWVESFHPIQSNRQLLIYSRKRLEARLLSQQHQNVRHVAHFLVYNVLANFQLFCIITCRDILYFVFFDFHLFQSRYDFHIVTLMTSSVLNLHNTKILNLSNEMRYDKKENSILHFTLFFNTSIFHFIGTLNGIKYIIYDNAAIHL